MRVATGAFNIARLSEEQRAKLESLANGIKADEGEEQDVPRLKSYGLKMKKPGLKALFGESPLAAAEDDELEKYFRLTKR
jgi:hypothetical protein